MWLVTVCENRKTDCCHQLLKRWWEMAEGQMRELNVLKSLSIAVDLIVKI